MGKNKNNRLNKIPGHLPVFVPDDLLWDKIEAELDFDQQLTTATKNLPIFETEYELWSSISQQLPSTFSQKNRTIKRHQWVAIAASFLLIVSLSVFLISRPQHEKLLVETEIEYIENFSDDLTHAEEQSALQVIEKMCANNQPACNSAEFREKIELYNELEQEASKLETVVKNIGESPEIIKTMIRIENMKSQTIQELITLANS